MAELQVFPVTLRDGSVIGVEAEKQPTKNEIFKIEQAVLGERQPERSIEEAVATGAATGLAPSAAFLKTYGIAGRALAPAPLPVRIIGPLIAGAGAATATGLAQSELLQRYMPRTAEAIQEMAQTRPIATSIGSAITSGFRPGGISAGGIRQDLLERLPAAALGGGIQAGSEAFQMEGGELPAGAGGRIAEAALFNAILNRETGYGRAMIGPAPVAPVQAPRTRPQTPVTDNLGQVKAGEPLPSATAKANQMATGGAEAAPSPTQELKQTKANIEAQTRQEEQVLSDILGGFGSETSRGVVPERLPKTVPPGEEMFSAEGTPGAAAESARAFTEQPAGVIPSAAEATTAFLEGAGGPVSSRQQVGLAEDLIGELQSLTNRSRQAIIKDADAANITELPELITWLRGEVGYARNPLSNPERRVSELTVKVREAEAEANRKLKEILGFEPEEPTVRREARTAAEIKGAPRTREGAAEIPILAGPERQKLSVQRGAVSPRLLQLERPIYDSGFKDQSGNIIWVDEFGRSVNARAFEGPRETIRPEAPTPQAEPAPAKPSLPSIRPEVKAPLSEISRQVAPAPVAAPPAPAPSPAPAAPAKPISRRGMADMRRQIRELDSKARQAAQTSPEKAGEFTQQAQNLREQLAQAEAVRPEGRAPNVGLAPDGNPDLLSDVAEYVGVIRTKAPEGTSQKGGEYDGWNEVLGQGAARLLRGNERGMKPDQALEIINSEGGYKFQSISEFQEAIARAVAQRRSVGAAVQKQTYQQNVEGMALQNARQGRKTNLRPKEATTVQDIGRGGSFTLNKEKFSVIDVVDDPDTGTLVYVIKDGHKFEVPYDTPIFADK